MRLRPFSLSLSRPLGTAHGEIRERRGFLVAVDPEVDPVSSRGVGEATPLPGWTESAEACERTLRRAVDDPERIPVFTDRTEAETERATVPEDVPAARHALALARDDARARAEGVPLAKRLLVDATEVGGVDENAGAGGVDENAGAGGVDAIHEAVEADRAALPASVPVNATIGDGSIEETVEAAERAVEAGYGCLKVKVGVRDVATDVERLRATRRAVGSDVSLRADANGAWSREAASNALDRLRDVDLEYVEQPVPAADLAGLAGLREAGGVPMAADESLVRHGLDAVLEAAAADVVVAKPMALGGPDRTVDLAVRAAAAGVDTVVTTTVDAVVARTAAVHVAAAVHGAAAVPGATSDEQSAGEPRACGLATGGLVQRDLAADPCPVDRGSVVVPTDPGLAGDAFDDVV